MSARAEFEPLSWEEAEENRREALPQILPDPRQRDLSQDGEQGSLAFAMSGSRSPIGTQENWRALLQRRDQLGREIKKGKERLEDIQKELMESRLVLEQWPVYEKQCGRNPLPHLMQSVAAKEHVENFLQGWLRRHKDALAEVVREIEGLARKGDTARAGRFVSQGQERPTRMLSQAA